MLISSNCFALLLPIKIFHYLAKFPFQPMSSTCGCQQTNLKMNNENTEILLCGTKARFKSVRLHSLKLRNNIIDFSSKAKKHLGMCLENNLSMDNAVSYLSKSCHLELRKIANFRSYLSDAATQKFVLSLVISKVDYCNFFFYNTSVENIYKLQLIQNHAASLVKRCNKRIHY